MNLKRFVLLCLCICGSLFTTTAQKKKGTSIYLMPTIMGQKTFSTLYWPEKLPTHINNIPIKIKSITPKPLPNVGVELRVVFPTNKSFSLGYYTRAISYGVRYSLPGDSLYAGYSGENSTAIPARRINVSFHNTFKTWQIKRKKAHHQLLERFKFIDKDFKYYAVVDISYMIGVSYERIVPFNDGQVGIFNFPVELVGSNTILNKSGIGFNAGLNFGFKKNGEKKFEIGIIYQKGLNKRARVDWNAIIDNEATHAFTTVSKGSMLALYAGIPVRVATIKNRNE